MSRTPATVGKPVLGYLSSVAVRALRDGVVYVFTLSTVQGEEVVFRLRIPPEWAFVGTPVSGYVVKADDFYEIQDLSEAKELAQPRAVQVDSCEVIQVPTGLEKQAIITGRVGNAVLSAPAISSSVAKKAEKLGFQKCVLFIAGLPTGNRVVAVQSIREFRRDSAMKRFMTTVGADEQQ
ncbi:MAG: hypothetical protein RMI49_02500 [Candidatus Caldarchaeum sp.]|nr:hypothetical protein [Candidatus Caldarchaeum sp.]